MEQTAITTAAVDTRGSFILKTYLHVVASIVAFVGIEYLLFASGIAEKIAGVLMGSWLLVIGALVLVSYLVSKFSSSIYSKSVQYGVLGAYVLIEALVFVPLLYVAISMFGIQILTQAAVITIGMTVALTAIVYIFRADFSFLAPFLFIFGIGALILIVLSLIFGFQLGLFFIFAMITYAVGAILYESSQIMRNYDSGEYVGAAISLLASIFLLLWYVVQALMMGDE